MPDLELEDVACAEVGSLLVAGLDEAGRGAIAGPVVAAAVILPLERERLPELLAGVDDSKKLTSRTREGLFDLITGTALTFGIGWSSADEIDQFGIIGATMMAMRMAAAALEPQPRYLLVDGRMKLKGLPLPQRSIIRGDGKSLSIAAASILAKVTRDRTMLEHQDQYPDYGFGRHKGYCTASHVTALDRLGPCPIHRRTFAPIRQTLI